MNSSAVVVHMMNHIFPLIIIFCGAAFIVDEILPRIYFWGSEGPTSSEGCPFTKWRRTFVKLRPKDYLNIAFNLLFLEIIFLSLGICELRPHTVTTHPESANRYAASPKESSQLAAAKKQLADALSGQSRP